MPKYGLILVLLLAKTLAQEDPEPIFKAVGQTLHMFFCFGVDYITVYRINEGEKLLLWNSSHSVSPPDDYKNRIKAYINTEDFFGFQITDLKLSDEGVYQRECWTEGSLTKQQTNYLYMCGKEIHFQKHFLEKGSVVLNCNISFSEQHSTTIKWFNEVYPGYKTTLLLDTEKSHELLQEELNDAIKVQDKGFSLYISHVDLENNNNFYCLVMERGQCKHFKHIQLAERNQPEIQTVYFAVGEEAVLSCISEHLNEQQKHWNTPAGEVSATTPLSQMFMSDITGSMDNALVIPSITLNHTGKYTCSSQLVVAEYYIILCPELNSSNIQTNSGEKVILDCTFTKDESANILWYRQRQARTEIIYDSEDPSINLPDDIKGRTIISLSNSSLIITDLNENDSGTYWCVMLQDSIAQENDEEEGDDDDEEDDDYDPWVEEDDYTETCIFKNVIQLKIQSKNVRHMNIDRESLNVDNISPQTEPESSQVLYAIIGGVLGVVILGLIVVCVVKIRAKRRPLDSRRVGHRVRQKNPSVTAPLMSL